MCDIVWSGYNSKKKLGSFLEFWNLESPKTVTRRAEILNIYFKSKVYIMIYTLLYISPLLRGNKNRNIYMYAIGTCVYAIIHCILFSTLGEKNEFVRKYRNILYLIVASDLVYIKYKYDAEAKELQNQTAQTHHTGGSQIPNPNMTQVNKQHGEHVNPNTQTCNGQVCQNTQQNVTETGNVVKHEAQSNYSLPVYVPQLVHEVPHAQHVNTSGDDNISLPVYESIQRNTNVQ